MKDLLKIVLFVVGCAAVMAGIASLGGTRFLPQFTAALVMLPVFILSPIICMLIGGVLGKRLTGDAESSGFMGAGFLIGMLVVAPGIIALINHLRH